MFIRAAEYWQEAIRIAPTNYIEAQNWLLTTGRKSDIKFHSYSIFRILFEKRILFFEIINEFKPDEIFRLRYESNFKAKHFFGKYIGLFFNS